MVHNKNMLPSAHIDSGQPTRLRYSVRGLANWILDFAEAKGFPVTNMALNKLLYFAVERVLTEYKILITDARIEAWDHGPVFREVYQAFKDHGDKPIVERVSFYSVDSRKMERSSVELDEKLEKLIIETLEPLLPLSASRLRNMSHVDGGPWNVVWSHEGYANPGMEITPEIILSSVEPRGHCDAKH